MRKILSILIMLSLVAGLFAAKLESEGNKFANEGDAFFKSKKYTQALAKYEEALSKYDAALKAKEIASKEKSNKMIRNSYLAASKAGKYDKVVTYVQRMLANEKKKSKKRKLTFALAQIYDKKLKQTNKAIEVLTAYNAQKADLKTIRKIAFYYSAKKLNQPKKALEWYKKAYDLKADANIIQKIASLHIKLNQKSQAIQAYKSFIKINPSKKDKIKTYKNMGVLYSDLKQDAKSVAAFEKYLNLKYDEKIAILVLTKYIDLKQDAKILATANKILKKNPKQAFAIYSLGERAFNNKKMEEAKKWFSKITSNPTYGKNAKSFLEQLK